jgi:hypothetical protein
MFSSVSDWPSFFHSSTLVCQGQEFGRELKIRVNMLSLIRGLRTPQKKASSIISYGSLGKRSRTRANRRVKSHRLSRVLCRTPRKSLRLIPRRHPLCHGVPRGACLGRDGDMLWCRRSSERPGDRINERSYGSWPTVVPRRSTISSLDPRRRMISHAPGKRLGHVGDGDRRLYFLRPLPCVSYVVSWI